LKSLTSHKVAALFVFVLISLAACGQGTPTAMSGPPTATLVAVAPTNTPLSPTSTLTPIPPTATPPPTATSALPTATATPPASIAPPLPPEPTVPPVLLLSLEKSPQDFGKTGTFQVGLGDLDGDGDLDGVFANTQSNNSQVWLNDGGQFVDSGQKLTQYGHGVGLGDWDGDGDLDLFIACHFFVTPSKVYLNDGQGMFHETGQNLGDSGISGADLNVVDVNGDGKLDVHVMYYDPQGLPDKVYLSDGTGAFTDSGLALDEETIAWGDLDGDGDVDYFGKRWGQGYVVQLNDGSGRFTEGWQMEDSQSTVGGVALADLDGDGDLDALVANGFRSTGSFPSLLLWNNGGGQFIDSGQRLNETLGAELAVGDLDGDGDLDVFVASMGRPNEVWLNDGGQFIDSGLRLGENSDMTGKASLGDVDGDGDLDVFVGCLGGRAELWLNGGPADASAGGPSAEPAARSDTWIKTYGGTRATVSGDILLADNGGFFVVGTTNLQFEPEQRGDVYLLRTDAAGEVLWEKTYGGDGFSGGQSITPTGDGNLFIAGVTNSASAGMNAYLLKVDQDGNELWAKTYGGPLDEMVGAVGQTTDGDYLLGGNIVDPNDLVADPGAAGYGGFAGRSNIYLLKVDGKGNELWSRTHDSEDNVLAAAGVQTPDGGFLLLATITYFPDPDNDMLLIKLDENGDEVWSRTWEEGSAVPYDLVETLDGNYLISASYTSLESTGNPKEDYLFVKIDPEGNEIWWNTFGDPDLIDYGVALAQATDGGYVAVGERTKDLYTWEADIALVKIDENGQLLWQQIRPGSHTMISRILPYPDGGYVIAGGMFRDPVFNVLLMKTDSQGLLR
jgi:hypothetical protein